MLEKFLKNKKIWIPVLIAIIVIIGIIVVIFVGKDAKNSDEKGKSDVKIESENEKDVQNSDEQGTSNVKNESKNEKDDSENAHGEKKNESGLDVVGEDDGTKEDTVTPPTSWDGSENTNNKTNSSDSGSNNASNNSNSNNNSNSDNTENDNENNSGNQEEEDYVIGEDVLEDDKKFGTIF